MKIEALAILAIGALAAYKTFIWLKEAKCTPDPWGPEVEKALEQGEATPLCPHCLAPQEHVGWFCPECGATVGPFSNYLPTVYPFSVGDAVRAAVTGRLRPNPLIIIGYVLVALGFLSILAPVYLLFFFKNFQTKS